MGRGPLPPLVHKIMCGQKLEALRERALLSQLEVARRFKWSQSKVANIETAVSAVNRRDLELLLDLYEAADRDEFFELAAAARKQMPRWKGLLRNRFEGAMRQVVDMEFSAETARRHTSMVIPGLLQTEAYMRSLFRAHHPSPTQDQIEEFVEIRLARQAVLDNTDQRFGFDTVQVTYVEQYDGGDILHDGKALKRFTTLWEHQRMRALGPEQTRPFRRELSRP